jgi:hypothetical protein
MRVSIKLALVAVLFVLLPSLAGAQEAELLLFGGDSHKVFLGCINCSKYDAASVWNAYGSHGSRYSAESIWNKYVINDN